MAESRSLLGDVFAAPAGWGPQRRRAALALTFDNFGEASDLELGTWNGEPVGSHFTVRWLPELMGLLGDVRATYFIEASNAFIYPDEIRSWAAAGHEVAVHAWRHEIWGKCDASRRRTLLADSMAAMRSIGIEPAGFRPPGGPIPPEAWNEFAAEGLLYCSDPGAPGIRPVGTMLSLPFEWQHVDAFMLMEELGFLRVQFGDREQAYSVAEWEAVLNRALDTLLRDGGQRTLIFHPAQLAGMPERIAVLSRLVNRLRASPDLWVAPAAEIAEFVQASSDLNERAAA